MKARWMPLIGLFFVAAPAWGADDSATLDAHVAAVTRAGETPEGQQVVPQRLSQELGISAQTLQVQRQQTRLGWGEILIANRIAQRTGMTFSQVVGEFHSGKGWGEIARENHLNLGKLVRDVKSSQAAVQASTSTSASARARSGDRDDGITSGTNRTEVGASAGASAGTQGRGARRGEDLGATFGTGAAGQGAGQRGDLGVTFGSGASGHGSAGLGLGVRGGGRR